MLSPIQPVPCILAIDTSCDDTSAAVVRGRQVLSNIIRSQTELHQPYGGVFPTVAKAAHREAVGPVVAAALAGAELAWSAIDRIAVTQGPGLAPALEVGIEYAQQLAATHSKALVGINHLEGHVWSVWAEIANTALTNPPAEKDHQEEQPAFPAIGIVVSGGHTFFVRVDGVGQYQLLGETIDDAAGEALDKVGRALGLGYPAGAEIERRARRGATNPTTYPFPLPMTESGNYNLSFSGLKTAAKNLHTKLTAVEPLTEAQIDDFCTNFQTAVFRAITYKLGKILKNEFTQPVELWLGGGVAANHTLRTTLEALPGVSRLRVPPSLDLCRDNAAMIGLVAAMQNTPQQTEKLQRKPQWPLG